MATLTIIGAGYGLFPPETFSPAVPAAGINENAWSSHDSFSDKSAFSFLYKGRSASNFIAGYVLGYLRPARYNRFTVRLACQ